VCISILTLKAIQKYKCPARAVWSPILKNSDMYLQLRRRRRRRRDMNVKNRYKQQNHHQLTTQCQLF